MGSEVNEGKTCVSHVKKRKWENCFSAFGDANFFFINKK